MIKREEKGTKGKHRRRKKSVRESALVADNQHEEKEKVSPFGNQPHLFNRRVLGIGKPVPKGREERRGKNWGGCKPTVGLGSARDKYRGKMRPIVKSRV